MQSERDFNEQWRRLCSASLAEPPWTHRQRLVLLRYAGREFAPDRFWVTYGGEGRRKSTFDILIDGNKIGDYVALPRSPEQEAHFVDADYAIPAELIEGKAKITVRFQARDGNEIRGVFGVRTVRAGEAR